MHYDQLLLSISCVLFLAEMFGYSLSANYLVRGITKLTIDVQSWFCNCSIGICWHYNKTESHKEWKETHTIVTKITFWFIPHAFFSAPKNISSPELQSDNLFVHIIVCACSCDSILALFLSAWNMRGRNHMFSNRIGDNNTIINLRFWRIRNDSWRLLFPDVYYPSWFLLLATMPSKCTCMLNKKSWRRIKMKSKHTRLKTITLRTISPICLSRSIGFAMVNYIGECKCSRKNRRGKYIDIGRI